jgi:dUTP pyrophosphatase
MIIPGRALVPKLVNGIRSVTHQTQPCGVDLTLKRVFKFTSAGTIDFDNSLRTKANYSEVPMIARSLNLHRKDNGSSSVATVLEVTSTTQAPVKSVFLEPGSYSVEFNETIDVPLDMMGEIFTRSSLYRSGAFVVTGVVDSGYAGPLGGMLVVSNLHGINLVEGAKLAQIVFHQMTEQVEGYSGVYQQQPFSGGN